MNDNELYSQYYSSDLSKYEDKEKFRHRLLKYLEDFTNFNFPQNIYHKCRSQMGLDIERIPMPNLRQPDQERYAVEKLFAKRSISDILDFTGVCYYALAPHQDNNPHIVESLKRYIEEVNKIFREESMCYEIHDNGRVRYYPDDEFQRSVKCTLMILNKPKYHHNLIAFNDTLDDLYKNHGTESPITRLFKGIETFILSILNNPKFNRLNNLSIDNLIAVLTDKTIKDPAFTDNDRTSLSGFNDIFKGWVSMCHKYRHGKPEQQNIAIPASLFNMIFTIGVSVFRSLLEFDDKYQLIPTSNLTQH